MIYAGQKVGNDGEDSLYPANSQSLKEAHTAFASTLQTSYPPYTTNRILRIRRPTSQKRTSQPKVPLQRPR